MTVTIATHIDNDDGDGDDDGDDDDDDQAVSQAEQLRQRQLFQADCTIIYHLT